MTNEEKCCYNCEHWTHEAGDMSEVLGEKGYSVCGLNHFESENLKLISRWNAYCTNWRLEEEVEPLVTEDELLEMDPQAEPEEVEDDTPDLEVI